MARNNFLQDERIQFLAGRHYRTGGKVYIPGQVVDNAREWHNFESAVRTRYLIPVTEDVSELPTGLRRHVKQVDIVRARYSYDPAKEWVEPEVELAYNPDMKIDDLLGYLEEHPEDTESVLEMEREHKNRPRLISKLEERLTAPEEETIDV